MPIIISILVVYIIIAIAIGAYFHKKSKIFSFRAYCMQKV